jgi:orotidine-5'-phosphate decarboxylase
MKYNPIIVALDVDSAEAASTLVEQLHGKVGAYKVGLELFNSSGPQIFDIIRQSDPSAKIFYDAKFHDIPNTVAGGVKAAIRNGTWMVNIHASGGKRMMQAAVSAAQQNAVKTLVVAVTVLTSLDDQDLKNDLGVVNGARDQVIRLARLAKESGCDGVVASPHEIEVIKRACGMDFLVVTPGVRPAGGALGDQKRVMTPSEAVSKGADYIVVGRPITASSDPPDAAKSILDEVMSVSDR